jgi:hypothetical protein
MKRIRQRKGMVALIALAAALLCMGGSLLWAGKTHVGSGLWPYGGDSPGDYGGSEPEVTVEVSEQQYKRNCYVGGGMLSLFGSVILFGVIRAWKERNSLETSWERTISNPQNVQEILQHSELYRDDFRRWIKENHPNLIFRKGDESG